MDPHPSMMMRRTVPWMERKRKGKGIHPIPNQIQEGKNKDLSNIKCFHYHELGHYATKCLHKKANKKPSE